MAVSLPLRNTADKLIRQLHGRRNSMTLDTASVVAQLDQLLEDWSVLLRSSKYEDASDQGDEVLNAVVARMESAIARVAPNSIYTKEALLAEHYKLSPAHRLPLLAGVVRALREDVAAGWLVTIEELLHANTFADFLEMATELHSKGYKDAAAVIAGSVLESHLRLLCVRNGASTDDAHGRHKRADTMNADLVKVPVYNQLQAKQVTAWLAVRNSAAHGNYADYSADGVSLMIAGIEGFLLRHPA